MIAKKIRERREILGWTQKEVSLKAGVTREHISRIENNKAMPNISTLRKLSKAMGVSIAYFFKGDINEA